MCLWWLTLIRYINQYERDVKREYFCRVEAAVSVSTPFDCLRCSANMAPSVLFYRSKLSWIVLLKQQWWCVKAVTGRSTGFFGVTPCRLVDMSSATSSSFSASLRNMKTADLTFCWSPAVLCRRNTLKWAPRLNFSEKFFKSNLLLILCDYKFDIILMFYRYLKMYSTLLCFHYGRSQWPRGLRRRTAAARLRTLWVRIPPGVWMSVCCCVLSGRGLWTSWSLVQRSPTDCGASFVVCDIVTWWMWRPWPTGGGILFFSIYYYIIDIYLLLFSMNYLCFRVIMI